MIAPGINVAMDFLYLTGLKAKEENMRELVKLAEKREAKAKAEMAQLLESRSEMFETSGAPSEGGNAYDEHETRIEDAQRRMEFAKVKFGKLRTLCISSEQGFSSLLSKLMVALEEAAPAILQTNALASAATAQQAALLHSGGKQSAGKSTGRRNPTSRDASTPDGPRAQRSTNTPTKDSPPSETSGQEGGYRFKCAACSYSMNS